MIPLLYAACLLRTACAIILTSVNASLNRRFSPPSAHGRSATGYGAERGPRQRVLVRLRRRRSPRTPAGLPARRPARRLQQLALLRGACVSPRAAVVSHLQAAAGSVVPRCESALALQCSYLHRYRVWSTRNSCLFVPGTLFFV